MDSREDHDCPDGGMKFCLNEPVSITETLGNGGRLCGRCVCRRGQDALCGSVMSSLRSITLTRDRSFKSFQKPPSNLWRSTLTTRCGNPHQQLDIRKLNFMQICSDFLSDGKEDDTLAPDPWQSTGAICFSFI